MKFGKLEVVAFVAGMGVMVIEVGGARLLSAYVGDTLFSWTSSISVILAALALGYYIGGRRADARPDMKLLSVFLFAAGLFTLVTPFISQPVLNFSLTFGYEFGPLFASLALLAVPNVFLGMISPCAVRIKAKRMKAVGGSAGNIYAISTIGSIVGALLSGYLLVPFLGVSESFFLMSLLLVCTGVAVFGIKSIPIVAIVLLAFLVPMPQIYPLYPLSPNKLVYQADTPYYHLEVLNRSGALLLAIGPGVQTIAFANHTDSASLAYYTFQKIVYYGPNRVNSALYLGLGGGAMVTDLYRSTNASIDAVEIDPVVIQVAKEFFNISSGGRIKVYNQDARFFLRNSTKRYDMIVLDTYGASFSMPAYLVTLEAASEMRDHLNFNGSVIINLESPVEGKNASAFKAVYKTFASVFPNVYVFATAPDNLTSTQNVELIASLNVTRSSLLDFARELNGKVNSGDLKWIKVAYYNKTVNTTGYSVLTDDKNPAGYYGAVAMSEIRAQ